MYFDLEKIEHLTGLQFENEMQLYFYVLHQLEFLKVNNKNYTKKQCHKINDLFDIIRSLNFND